MCCKVIIPRKKSKEVTEVLKASIRVTILENVGVAEAEENAGTGPPPPIPEARPSTKLVSPSPGDSMASPTDEAQSSAKIWTPASRVSWAVPKASTMSSKGLKNSLMLLGNLFAPWALFLSCDLKITYEWSLHFQIWLIQKWLQNFNAAYADLDRCTGGSDCERTEASHSYTDIQQLVPGYYVDTRWGLRKSLYWLPACCFQGTSGATVHHVMWELIFA